MKSVKKEVCVISAYAHIVKHVNYGSLFQYYAIEKTLQSIGYSAYWLRLILPTVTNTSVKIKLKKVIFHNRYKAEKLILYSFRDYIKDYLHVSDKVYTEEQLIKECPKADAFITGSDQVWGGILSPNYLCFVPDYKKKIAYAASFGKYSIEPEHLKTITPWLKRFDNISVRELSGVRICKQINVDAKVVLDPTLLISSEVYPADENVSRKYGDYYFGYFLNITKKNKGSYITAIKKAKKDLGRIILVAGVSDIERFLAPKMYSYFTPKEWLGMYKNANGILTNTFHGTVFAIIYQRPFLVLLQSGDTEKQNERIFSLLKMFGLESRIYIEGKKVKEQMEEKIYWDKVKLVCQRHKNDSLSFLSIALEKV